MKRMSVGTSALSTYLVPQDGTVVGCHAMVISEHLLLMVELRITAQQLTIVRGISLKLAAKTPRIRKGNHLPAEIIGEVGRLCLQIPVEAGNLSR
jgi:hypothetical protein